MSGTASQLPAHKGLRGEVLLELKRAQPRTAKQLADTLGVSPNAVRHHLKELEAESLIVYGRDPRGGRAVPRSVRGGRAIPAGRLGRGRRAAHPHHQRLQRVRVCDHLRRTAARGVSMSTGIEAQVLQPYKYGFITDIEAEVVPPGLSEDVIRLISAKKGEPEWMLKPGGTTSASMSVMNPY